MIHRTEAQDSRPMEQAARYVGFGLRVSLRDVRLILQLSVWDLRIYGSGFG